MVKFFKDKNRDLKKNQRLGAPLITYYEPESVNSEQYRNLRTYLEFTQMGHDLKSIAITSSVPLEGKSTTSANLAYTMGQTGLNILIVDADLRKPTLHHTFRLNNEQGLTTLLTKQGLKFNEVVQRSTDLDLYFLPSGPKLPNPAELIRSPQMLVLMEELKNNFDLVIYDTPPVNSVTDAQILSTRVDGVILVVRQNFSRKDDVHKAKIALEKVNANVIGSVLNNAPIEGNEGYGYYETEDQEGT